MSKWKEKKLKDIGTIITGNTPPTKERDYYGDQYKFIKPTDMTEGLRFVQSPEEMLSEKGYERYKKSLIPTNTPCVVTIGSLGKKLCLTNEPSFTNQAVNAIIPFPENEGRYIYYYMKLMLPIVKNLSSGTASGRENVSKTSFSNIKILCPSLPTQKKIADILSAYDDLIDNNNQRIELLEKVAQNLYKEWFVHFRFANYKQTKFEKGLPYEWEVVKVKNIVRRLPFGTLYKENDVLFEGKVIVIDQSRKDHVGFHNNKPSHEASIDKPIIIFGDHSCKMQIMINDFSLSENVVPFISQSDIPIVFLFYLVNSLIKTTEYKRHWTDFMSKKVLLPQKQLTKMFEEQIKNNMVLINNLQSQNRNLIKQRDLLLPRLMSGKLEV